MPSAAQEWRGRRLQPLPWETVGSFSAGEGHTHAQAPPSPRGADWEAREPVPPQRLARNPTASPALTAPTWTRRGAPPQLSGRTAPGPSTRGDPPRPTVSSHNPMIPTKRHGVYDPTYVLFQRTAASTVTGSLGVAGAGQGQDRGTTKRVTAFWGRGPRPHSRTRPRPADAPSWSPGNVPNPTCGPRAGLVHGGPGQKPICPAMCPPKPTPMSSQRGHSAGGTGPQTPTSHSSVRNGPQRAGPELCGDAPGATRGPGGHCPLPRLGEHTRRTEPLAPGHTTDTDATPAHSFTCQRRHRGFFLHFFCSGTFLIPARSQRWRSDRGSLRKAGVGRRTLASESGRNSCYLVTAGVLGTGAGPACQVTTWFVGSDAHRF